MGTLDLGADLTPLLGEFAWHSLTLDPTIPEVSEKHYELVKGLLERYGPGDGRRPLTVLEVASYAHTTGYALRERLGAEVTLFEISARTLQLGRRLANCPADADNPRLVVGDFHDLPFRDGSFDFVYICSALHHTWRWRRVAGELQRVLAPGGVLFFENEPCRRACCFYKFRTNRPHDFIPFETRLNELGLLQTVAEPYLGSRPETLFGMVENQTIPLDALLAQLSTGTEVVEATFTPETCMTPMNHAWVRQAALGRRELGRVIEHDLLTACRAAGPALDDVAAGLGYSLPSPAEVRALARQIAPRIVALELERQGRSPARGGVAGLFDRVVRLFTPGPPTSPALGPLRYRIGLAQLFGAPVRLVVRKRAAGAPAARGEFKQAYPKLDGITYTFHEALRRFLMGQNSLWPDLQEAPEETLRRFFPAPGWQRVVTPPGIAVLNLAESPAAVELPAAGPDAVLILRMNGGPPAGCHLRVALRDGDRELRSFAFWKPEAVLCVLTLAAGGRPRLRLHCEAVAKDGSRRPLGHHLNLNYVGLFAPPRGQARKSA